MHFNFLLTRKLPVRHVPPGLVSAAAKDRATLHIHSRLGKVYKKALVVPPSSPYQRAVRLWGMHRHCTGWRLVGVPLRSTL